jgi:hypothetical protein
MQKNVKAMKAFKRRRVITAHFSPRIIFTITCTVGQGWIPKNIAPESIERKAGYTTSRC